MANFSSLCSGFSFVTVLTVINKVNDFKVSQNVDQSTNQQYKRNTKQDIAIAFTRTSMPQQNQCMSGCTHNVKLDSAQLNFFGFILLKHAN